MPQTIRGILRFTALAAALSQAQPTIAGVTNGASYSGNLAPGTWATIFGSQLASKTATAASVPLPAWRRDSPASTSSTSFPTAS